jgi:hypothetical protein
MARWGYLKKYKGRGGIKPFHGQWLSYLFGGVPDTAKTKKNGGQITAQERISNQVKHDQLARFFLSKTTVLILTKFTTRTTNNKKNIFLHILHLLVFTQFTEKLSNISNIHQSVLIVNSTRESHKIKLPC